MEKMSREVFEWVILVAEPAEPVARPTVTPEGGPLIHSESCFCKVIRFTSMQIIDVRVLADHFMRSYFMGVESGGDGGGVPRSKKKSAGDVPQKL